MSATAWRMPEPRRAPIAASAVNARRWKHALFTEPTLLEAFRKLDMPVLFLLGGQTTESARGGARRLVATLPRVEVLEFEELGHMGPVTHPEQVNAAIARFLERA